MKTFARAAYYSPLALLAQLMIFWLTELDALRSMPW